MPIGKYFVRVIVNGNFIPSYQYVSIDQAYVTVSDSNTPKIDTLIPFKGEPGSFVTVNGDFKVITTSLKIFSNKFKITYQNLKNNKKI